MVLCRWLEGVLGEREEDVPDVKGVVDAGEEIGVVADLHWDVGFGFMFGEECFFLK
jgi:hypothetical protein